MACALVVLALGFLTTSRIDLTAVAVFSGLLIWAENAAVLLPTSLTLSPSFMVVVASLAAFNGHGSVLGAGLVGACGGLALDKLRRQRFWNVGFNCAQYVVSGAAAGFVEMALRSLGWPTPTALIAAGVAFAAVNIVLVLPAVALETGSGAGAVWAEMYPVLPNYLAFGLLGALIGLLYTRFGALSVVVLAMPLVIARSFFAAFLRLRQAYRRLEVVYGFTRNLGGSLDVDAVVGTTLSEVQRLLEASRVDLAVAAAEGTLTCWSLVDGAPVHSNVASHRRPLLDSVLRSGEPLVVRDGAGEPALLEAAAAAGFRNVMAVPVGGEGRVVGTLLVADREDGTPFEAEDLQLLGTLANHVGVAFHNGQLVEQLRQESTHDALTGLANRSSFLASVDAAVQASEADRITAVMLMDIDRFTEVNDTLGHQSGDLLLREIGIRLAQQVDDDAVIARLGGDEFAVLVPNLVAEADVELAVTRVLMALDRPFPIGDLNLEAAGSIGVAVCPDHGTDAVTLLQRADVAMYSTKGRGAGWALYHPDQDVHTTRRLMLAADLRHATDNGEMAVYYQPKAALGDGRIVGVEALLRWCKPDIGFVPPDEFIPLAEHTGLIRSLTRWTLAAAIHQCGTWARQGLDLTMAVNLSARALGDELPEQVAELLRGAVVPPSSLVLEITEIRLMADPVRSIGILERLSAMGVTVSINDFGTGYSSLSYLKRLPVNEVKVDKSFVLQMMANRQDAAIVRSTVDLARNLGLRVVAEGVEDRETWEELASLGCDQAQGYFLTKPINAQAFERWLSGYAVDTLLRVS